MDGEEIAHARFRFVVHGRGFCLLAVVTLTEVVVGLVAVLAVCGGYGWVAEVMMNIPLCSFKVLGFFVFVLAF